MIDEVNSNVDPKSVHSLSLDAFTSQLMHNYAKNRICDEKVFNEELNGQACKHDAQMNNVSLDDVNNSNQQKLIFFQTHSKSH